MKQVEQINNDTQSEASIDNISDISNDLKLKIKQIQMNTNGCNDENYKNITSTEKKKVGNEINIIIASMLK